MNRRIAVIGIADLDRTVRAISEGQVHHPHRLHQVRGRSVQMQQPAAHDQQQGEPDQ